MAGEKPFPRITNWTDVRSVFPPDRRYRYLEHCDEFPFRHGADWFDLVNAWWLMELSFLVYVDDADFVKQTITSVVDDVEVDCLNFGMGIGECLIVHNSKFVIVAYRGTLLDSPSHVLTDLWAVPRTARTNEKVHSGFHWAVDRTWERIAAHIKHVRHAGQLVFFTGHSLGAAMATIAAQRCDAELAPVQALYTFGSPRVGDRVFARDFGLPAYRVCNDKDIFCRVPPQSVRMGRQINVDLYRHVGASFCFDAMGNLTPREPAPSRQPWKTLREVFRDAKREEENRTFLKPLIDHSPKVYAIRLWNTLIRSGEGENDES